MAMVQGFSQRIELEFTKLSGDTVWLYTFSGSRVDSMSVNLNRSGKYTVVLPNTGYRGMAYLYIPEKGGGEFMLAEPHLKITCPEEQFHGGMLEFPQSPENTFMRYIFERQGYLSARQEWLQNGEYFVGNKDEADFDVLYNKMVKDNEAAIKQLEDTLAHSTFYTARFIDWIHYMQRLYAAVQRLDAAQQIKLKEEMETQMDINALYHAGNLWTDVHTYYPGLFVDTNDDLAQEAYATSILTTMERLKEPELTAFLSTALTACERTNRQKAQEVMLREFVMRYPMLPVSDSKLRRMLGAVGINKGNPAPEIEGLQKPITQPVILIFFDSDCDHCRHEVNYLIEHYKEFSEKGYRIISVAADTHQNNYQFFSATFPWNKEDRLCDFKGFQGENFKNYGLIGTPVIFTIDGNGVITGKYAQAKEIMNNE